MGEGAIVGLLLSCAVTAFAGAVGQWVGANIMSGFALVAVLSAYANHADVHWLQVVAPIAFAYAAAGIAVFIERSKSR